MFFTINSTTINNYSRLVKIVIKLIRYRKNKALIISITFYSNPVTINFSLLKINWINLRGEVYATFR